MLRYRTGQEPAVGDVVQTSTGHVGVVKMLLVPGTEYAEGFACAETGGLLIEEDWDGVPSLLVEIPDSIATDVSLIRRGTEGSAHMG